MEHKSNEHSIHMTLIALIMTTSLSPNPRERISNTYLASGQLLIMLGSHGCVTRKSDQCLDEAHWLWGLAA